MMNNQISKELDDLIAKESAFVDTFFQGIEKVIVGQRKLLERFLVGLLANGHILIEGVPGLAKTLAVKSFSYMMHTTFKRIQFTPDMLPADLTGGLIYDQATGTFKMRKGPIFTNILLADEINRAPAKVQSALLEVMQEKQVTVGEHTFDLKEPFMVLATQNPIEQDGTYLLPESQLDRFMFNIRITYPSRAEESRIMREMSFTDKNLEIEPVFDPSHILQVRQLVNQVYVDEKVENYILDIVEATRDPIKYGLKDLVGLIQFGVSPRATIHLTIAARAYAFIHGRSYVRPQDIKDIAMDVLRHRLIESYSASTNRLTAEDIIQKILDELDMP